MGREKMGGRGGEMGWGGRKEEGRPGGEIEGRGGGERETTSSDYSFG